jgi:hypothetical protein
LPSADAAAAADAGAADAELADAALVAGVLDVADAVSDLCWDVQVAL